MRALIRELFETTLLALLIFLLLHVSIGNRRVDGPSMNPTLTHGQRVIVNKLRYLSFSSDGPVARLPFVDFGDQERLYAFEPPERGDVVVFHSLYEDDRDLVKRVIAVPGETVEIKRGVVFVDGVELDEPYIIGPERGDMPPLLCAGRRLLRPRGQPAGQQRLAKLRRRAHREHRWTCMALRLAARRHWHTQGPAVAVDGGPLRPPSGGVSIGGTPT